MFTDSAAIYDAVYSFKDYAAESERLRTLIEENAPGATTLLDVACGTGKHLEQLRATYEVTGLDLDPDLLEIARVRLGDVELHVADMTDFALGRRFDVVTCLFSSIGYVGTVSRLERAIEAMASAPTAGRPPDRRAVADTGRVDRRPAAPARGRRARPEDRAHDDLRSRGPARDHELRVPGRHARPGSRLSRSGTRPALFTDEEYRAAFTRRRALGRARSGRPDRSRALRRPADYGLIYGALWHSNIVRRLDVMVEVAMRRPSRRRSSRLPRRGSRDPRSSSGRTPANP